MENFSESPIHPVVPINDEPIDLQFVALVDEN
jgi:hypothetical protein